MFSNEIARVINEERIRRIRFEAVQRAEIRMVASRPARSIRSIRRSIGRRIVEIGRAIEADQACGPIGDLVVRQ